MSEPIEPRHPPRPWLICLALAAVTLAVYSPVFHYAFINYDDQIYVTENPAVLSGLNRHSLAWAFRTSTSGNWIPLTWISHILDVECHGLHAGGHHLTNVLLHAANAVLLFVLLRRMTGALLRSAVVAALFAWHPAHVESVAWIAERKDVLCSFFFLLSLLAYVAYAKGRKAKTAYVLSILCFALALMAKPMAVTLPCILLLLDFWPLGRMTKKECGRLFAEKIPWFILAGACCAVTVWAQQRQHALVSATEIPLARRLGHALASYFQYLVTLVFPHRLAVFYPYPNDENATLVAAGAAVFLICSIAALAGARRRPWLLVGWLWFAGMLVPVIGLVQIGDQSMADRYTYLPSIGFFIAVVWAGKEIAGRFRLAPLLAPAACLALLLVTARQITYWKDIRTLFQHAADVTHDNFVAMALLGTAYANDGHLDAAIALYRQALRVRPGYAQADFFLGRALEQEGKTDEAMAAYRQAISLRPWFEQARLFLGLLLTKQRHYDEASAEFEAALKLNPHSAPAHNDMGHLLELKGKLDDSISQYQDAIRWDPALAQAHNNLGVVYLQTSRPEEAAIQLRQALALDPTNAQTEFNLGMALNQLKQWPEALPIWKRAATALSDNAAAHYQYGLALRHLGNTREAMAEFAHAILLKPDFADALNELAWIAATDSRPELRNGPQAVALAQQACEITGQKKPEFLLTLAAGYAEMGRFEEAQATLLKLDHFLNSSKEEALKSRVIEVKGAIQKRQPFHTTGKD